MFPGPRLGFQRLFVHRLRSATATSSSPERAFSSNLPAPSQQCDHISPADHARRQPGLKGWIGLFADPSTGTAVVLRPVDSYSCASTANTEAINVIPNAPVDAHGHDDWTDHYFRTKLSPFAEADDGSATSAGLCSLAGVAGRVEKVYEEDLPLQRSGFSPIEHNLRGKYLYMTVDRRLAVTAVVRRSVHGCAKSTTARARHPFDGTRRTGATGTANSPRDGEFQFLLMRNCGNKTASWRNSSRPLIDFRNTRVPVSWSIT
ncbi:hypothetical protein C8R46DRAFT_1031414 [Mycena filopes]|nr:hypothetical protein C8R46DRAFT_1031414 [Mycena filopes]